MDSHANHGASGVSESAGADSMADSLIDQAVADFKRQVRRYSRDGAFGNVTLRADFNGGRISRVECAEARTFRDTRALERARTDA